MRVPGNCCSLLGVLVVCMIVSQMRADERSLLASDGTPTYSGGGERYLYRGPEGLGLASSHYQGETRDELYIVCEDIYKPVSFHLSVSEWALLNKSSKGRHVSEM